jgi:hypothetical protein
MSGVNNLLKKNRPLFGLMNVCDGSTFQNGGVVAVRVLMHMYSCTHRNTHP